MVLLFFTCTFSVLKAQLKIIVSDQATNFLPDVHVQILKNNQQIAEGITDVSGQVAFFLPQGNYELVVFKDLYFLKRCSIIYSNQVNTFELIVSSVGSVLLDSIVFSGSGEVAGFNGNIEAGRLQYRTMTASFQDPSRILIHFPGYTTDNDGTNSFTFRGMPSYGQTWMIDNVEIVNPNHLTTAGNRGDALSLNSGGVNSISGSVIGAYSFISSPASAMYDNVMGGVSNIKLSQNIRNFADFNLVGFEAGLGSTFKNRQYYATYRYSFVGLLERLGISFGNESIQYSDFTIHGELFKSKRTLLKSYFIYGNSSNIHKAKIDTDSKESIKDFKDINYKANMAIGGISFAFRQNNEQNWNINLAVSQRIDNNQESINRSYSELFPILGKEREFISRLISLHAFHDLTANKFNLKTGIRHTYSFIKGFLDGLEDNNHFYRTYPYSVLTYNIAEKLIAEAGIGSQLTNLRAQSRVNLNLFGGLKWEVLNILYAELKYRRADFGVFGTLTQVPMTAKGDHIQIGAGLKNAKFHIRSSLFAHIFTGIPVGRSPEASGLFSGFHGIDFGTDAEINPADIFYNGKARVYGMDIFGNVKQSWNKNNLEVISSMSLFSSKYKNPGVNWDNSRNNVGYIMHTAVYYSLLSKNNKKWIAGVSWHHRGGQRDPEIRPDPVLDESIYIADSPFSYVYSPYKRIDIRLVYSKSSAKGITHRFSLDLQNIAGIQNDGLRYYDPYLNTIVNQKQLGLIPVLGYRIEF